MRVFLNDKIFRVYPRVASSGAGGINGSLISVSGNAIANAGAFKTHTFFHLQSWRCAPYLPALPSIWHDAPLSFLLFAPTARNAATLAQRSGALTVRPRLGRAAACRRDGSPPDGSTHALVASGQGQVRVGLYKALRRAAIQRALPSSQSLWFLSGCRKQRLPRFSDNAADPTAPHHRPPRKGAAALLRENGKVEKQQHPADSTPTTGSPPPRGAPPPPPPPPPPASRSAASALPREAGAPDRNGLGGSGPPSWWECATCLQCDLTHAGSASFGGDALPEKPIGVQENVFPVCDRCWGCRRGFGSVGTQKGLAGIHKNAGKCPARGNHLPALLLAPSVLRRSVASAAERAPLTPATRPLCADVSHTIELLNLSATWRGEDRNIRMHPGNTGASIFLATALDGRQVGRLAVRSPDCPRTVRGLLAPVPWAGCWDGLMPPVSAGRRCSSCMASTPAT